MPRRNMEPTLPSPGVTELASAFAPSSIASFTRVDAGEAAEGTTPEEGSPSSDAEAQNIHGPQYHKQIRIFLIVIMISISIFGNSLAMKRICHRWSRGSRTTILFLHLTLADLAVTLFTMVSQLTWEVMDRAWLAGDVFCRVNKVLQTFAISSSNFVLVSIAIDRCLAIVYPLRVRTSSPHWLALGAWAASLLPALPNLYTFHLVPSGGLRGGGSGRPEGGDYYCVSKFYSGELSTEVRQVYMLAIFLMVTVVPCVLMVVLYSAILLSLTRHDRTFSLRSHRGELAPAEASPRHCANGLARAGSRRTSSRRWQKVELEEEVEDEVDGREQSLKEWRSVESEEHQPRASSSLLPQAKVKTLNLSIAVVAAFLLTNLPYLTYEMCIAFRLPVRLQPEAVAIMGIVSASNSAINPFIYLLFQSRSPWAQRFTTLCCPCTARPLAHASPHYRVVFRKATPSTTSSGDAPRLPRAGKNGSAQNPGDAKPNGQEGDGPPLAELPAPRSATLQGQQQQAAPVFLLCPAPS